MTRLTAALGLLAAATSLTACASIDTDFLPSFLAPKAAEPSPGVSAVVMGESGLAAGIPAAVQTFPEPGEEPVLSYDPARLPTMFPRQLPSQDAAGEDFADRVSLAPDGRRLAVGTQQGANFEVQIVGVNRKDVERTVRDKGNFAFVAWADPRTILVGAERGGELRIQAMDIGTGKARTLSSRKGEGGVLTVNFDGTPVTIRPGRSAFACANGTPMPGEYKGRAAVQAGPPDPQGRPVLRTTSGKGALVPFDCDAGRFAAPIYEGDAFDGALFDAGGSGYVGVWDENGPRYTDRSLAFEMREVEASFPGDVTVWPIEFARSPNTLLLYVSGAEVPPSYYVLDRYAGALDLHVSYQPTE